MPLYCSPTFASSEPAHFHFYVISHNKYICWWPSVEPKFTSYIGFCALHSQAITFYRVLRHAKQHVYLCLASRHERAEQWRCSLFSIFRSAVRKLVCTLSCLTLNTHTHIDTRASSSGLLALFAVCRIRAIVVRLTTTFLSSLNSLPLRRYHRRQRHRCLCYCCLPSSL